MEIRLHLTSLGEIISPLISLHIIITNRASDISDMLIYFLFFKSEFSVSNREVFIVFLFCYEKATIYADKRVFMQSGFPVIRNQQYVIRTVCGHIMVAWHGNAEKYLASTLLVDVCNIYMFVISSHFQVAVLVTI